MASMYFRRDRIYFRVPGVDGSWKSIRSSFVRGQERAARKTLADMEAMRAARKEVAVVDEGPLTLARYSEIWLEERRRAGIVDWRGEAAKLRDHVVPFIGHMELNSIRPKHISDLMKRLAEKTDRPIGRKTRRNVYGIIKSLLRDAKIADFFLGEDPCILPSMAFGNEHEKDPEWRAKAIFTSSELVRLITDETIPEDRRVFYALMGVGGCRLGEAAALRMRNVDLDRYPLGGLLIARSHEQDWTKGKFAREVPIHPVLAGMLAVWTMSGWEKMVGRAPTPDDLLVPMPPQDALRRRGDVTRESLRTKTYAYKRAKQDLADLGLRHRREHDLRRTMVTLMREAGARKEVLVTITHNPRRETIDMYTVFSWTAKCAEVVKLKFDIPPAGGTTPSSKPSRGTPLEAGAGGSLATTLATVEQKPEENQALVLWRRRVLPPGPEGLHLGCYVRVRRFDSHTRVGPPTGRPGCQPSLCLAFGPEDAARTQSPLSCRFPRP